MADAVCPIDEWMSEDYHFTIEEQLTIGFALAAMTNTWNEDVAAGTRSRIVPEHLDDLFAKLGFAERKQELLDLVSAERTEYAAEYAEAGTEIEKLAWETRPLMRHPFLRTEDGSLLLLSPRAIQSWLTDGFHYRLLRSAQKRSASDPKRKTSRRYTAYAGELLEEHVLRLVRSSYGERPIGSGRVYGDQPYETKDGEAKTSDVAIDLGKGPTSRRRSLRSMIGRLHSASSTTAGIGSQRMGRSTIPEAAQRASSRMAWTIC